MSTPTLLIYYRWSRCAVPCRLLALATLRLHCWRREVRRRAASRSSCQSLRQRWCSSCLRCVYIWIHVSIYIYIYIYIYVYIGLTQNAYSFQLKGSPPR